MSKPAASRKAKSRISETRPGDVSVRETRPDAHHVYTCKALTVLIESHGLTPREAAARAGLDADEIFPVPGEVPTAVRMEDMVRLIRVCGMTSREFFGVLYDLFPRDAAGLKALPPDERRRVRRLRTLLTRADLVPPPDFKAAGGSGSPDRFPGGPPSTQG